MTGASQASVLILGWDWMASSPFPHFSVGYVSKCERICFVFRAASFEKALVKLSGQSGWEGSWGGVQHPGAQGAFPVLLGVHCLGLPLSSHFSSSSFLFSLLHPN